MFKVCKWLGFDIWVHLWNHSHNQDSEQLLHPPKFPPDHSMCLFACLLLTASLKYNLHNRNFTHLKCPIQSIWIYWWSCSAITTTCSQNIFIHFYHPKRRRNLGGISFWGLFLTFNFQNYGKIHIKFTILTMFQCTVHSGIKSIHTVVQPSPPSISRTLWILQNWNCTHETTTPLVPPSQPPATTILLSVSMTLATLGISYK